MRTSDEKRAAAAAVSEGDALELERQRRRRGRGGRVQSDDVGERRPTDCRQTTLTHRQHDHDDDDDDSTSTTTCCIELDVKNPGQLAGDEHETVEPVFLSPVCSLSATE